MRGSLTIAKISKIPIKLHYSFLFSALLITWTLAAAYFPMENPNWTTQVYWITGIVTSILFFASVLLHEIGHAMVAVEDDVPVQSITLFIFGGVAHIGHEPETADSEFRIVVAGPFTSMFLAAFFSVLSNLTAFNPAISASALYLSRLNLVLALFNLIPGFPLDGGRILRAVFWKLNHDFFKATRWATYAGIAIALMFIGGGVVMAMTGNFMGGIWMAFIGIYLGNAAYQSYRMTVAEEAELAFTENEAAALPPAIKLPAKPEWRLQGANFAFVRVVVRPEEFGQNQRRIERNDLTG